MKHYDADVIVVGAGPAGAISAKLLASWGVNVLLLEKCRLPRYKPCGGAITRRTLKFLAPLEISPVIETWVRKLTIRSPDGESFSVDLPEGLIATVMRDKFDAYLVDASIASGAKLRVSEPLIRCELKEDGIEVFTSRRKFFCRALIGADGAKSLVAQQLGLKTQQRAVSLVTELPSEAMERWNGGIHLYFPFAFYGYAWCFPKREHLSAGLYTYSPHLRNWSDWLYRYLASLELHDCFQRHKIRGHLIPIAGKNSSFHKGNAVVAGDAAGVADPFTGEGISWAIYTARMAASFVLSFLDGEPDALADYTRAVHEEVLSEMRTAHWFARLLFSFPRFSFHRLLHREPVLRNFSKLLAGEVSYRQLWHKALRKGLSLLKAQ